MKIKIPARLIIISCAGIFVSPPRMMEMVYDIFNLAKGQSFPSLRERNGLWYSLFTISKHIDNLIKQRR